MRRKDREVTDQAAIEQLLKDSEVLRLAIQDEDYPYIVPLNYGYEWPKEGPLTLYVHGATQGHKLDLIRKNNHVGVEIDADHQIITAELAHPEKFSYAYRSLIGQGQATIVENLAEKKKGLALLLAKVAPETAITAVPDRMIERTGVVKIEMVAFTAKQHAKK
jgi:nitroimidazol reductase NimA-like FMN-containing flavoprotein (pyridoxamine 5'-phosphate oxidase superfamily)